jgi:hypothetical protein
MDYTIVPIGLKEANDFVSGFHRHNKATAGHKVSLGLRAEDKLVGVAIAGRPVARGLDNHYTAEITRVCVKDGYPNACSYLYARMKRILMMMGYTRVVTYTLKSESQSSMKAIGAVPAAAIKARQWDRPSRPRNDQEVGKEDKIRWELQSHVTPPKASGGLRQSKGCQTTGRDASNGRSRIDNSGQVSPDGAYRQAVPPVAGKGKKEREGT